jgi:hypothetical protein
MSAPRRPRRRFFLLSFLFFSFLLLLCLCIIAVPSMSRRDLVVEKIVPDFKYLPKWRRRLAAAYDVHQSQLLRELTRLAKYQHMQHKGKSWEELIDVLQSLNDAPSDDNLVNFYLSQLHPTMLQAALKGQVPRMFFKDENFRRMVQNYHALYPSPGTYVTIPHRVEFLPTGNSQVAQPQASLRNPWAGHNLTPHELEIVCTAMTLYVRWDDPLTDVDAAHIDTRFPPPSHTEEKPLRRRYLRSGRAMEMIILWTARVKRLIIEPARNTPDWNIPLPWCFSEVGFGINQKSRALDHHVHDGTNYLFGLVTAVMWSKFPDEFTFMSLSMNFVARAEHANLSETIVSIIHGTYLLKETDWCGLNPKLAGGLHIDNMKTPRYNENWQQTENRLATKQYPELHVQAERAKWSQLVEDSKAVKDMLARHKELDDIEQKIKEKTEMLHEIKRDLKQPQPTFDIRVSIVNDCLSKKAQKSRRPSFPSTASLSRLNSPVQMIPESPSILASYPSTPQLESDMDSIEDQDDIEEVEEVAENLHNNAGDFSSFLQMHVRRIGQHQHGRGCTSNGLKRPWLQEEELDEHSETIETPVRKGARLETVSSTSDNLIADLHFAGGWSKV